jgi:hypothetical protein
VDPPFPQGRQRWLARPILKTPLIAKPNPAQPVVLVFGPDTGLVRERVNALVRASVDNPDDPFALARIEGDELAGNPSRLVEEALTVPLFGGRRAVLVKAGGRNIAPAVETVINAPSSDCRVIIEAGNLSKSAPLRALCEKSKVAAALPCYADNERALAQLIDEEMRAAGLSIAPDARAALVDLIGGDRLASRNEIRKLTLYAKDQKSVELPDVMAVPAGGDPADDLAVVPHRLVADRVGSFPARNDDMRRLGAFAMSVTDHPRFVRASSLAPFSTRNFTRSLSPLYAAPLHGNWRKTECRRR